MFLLLAAVVNIQAGVTKHVRLALIIERVATDKGRDGANADVRLSESCIVFEKFFARAHNSASPGKERCQSAKPHHPVGFRILRLYSFAQVEVE
jgi:hypothetical protein